MIGVLAALAVRDRDGIGQRVTVSMLDGLLSFSTYRAPQVFDVGPVGPDGSAQGGGGTRPYGPYRCSDGSWIAIGFAQPHWAAACRAMGAPELITDPRFATEHARNRNAAELEPVMAELLRRRPSGSGRRCFIAAGAPAGKVNTLKEAFAHPAGRRPSDHSGSSRTRPAGRRTWRGPDGDESGEPPAGRPPGPRGARLGRFRRPSATHVASGDGVRMPLDGTRVIEMDGNEPSKTLGTQILADLGADVLLIERPEPVRPRDPTPRRTRSR